MTHGEWMSPNHGVRTGEGISMVVLHYTGMKTAREALERLCDPDAGVSAHYLIEETGLVHRLVPEERRAWHAGVAQWGEDEDINSISIGIELVNPGHEFGYRDFPDAQVETLMRLLADIKERHAIPRARIVGHSDVAPDRKQDPGEKFPWSVLAAEDLAIGIWPGGTPARAPGREEAVSSLRTIGYAVDRFGLEPSVTAFQRRFCPGQLGRGLDAETCAAAAWACATIGACMD